MNVAVLGAGHMGHALALVFALGGHTVRLTDNDAATLARARPLMHTALATLRDAGEVAPEWTADRFDAAVTSHATLDDTLQGAALVVEAIIEDPAAKRALFARIDAIAPDDIIIACNTSYLDVFPLVPERRRRRFLIAHWYTPPYLVDLCDIVGGDDTDPAIVEQVRGIVQAMGKTPVVMKKFIPGYIANRVQSAIALEVNRLVDEGYATPRDIDDAMIHGLALRLPILGVMAKADFTGLKLTQAALAQRVYAPPPVRGRSDALEAVLARGHTGVMSGQGYFDYGGRSPDALFQDRDRKLLALKRALREIGTMIPEAENSPDT